MYLLHSPLEKGKSNFSEILHKMTKIILKPKPRRKKGL